MRHLTFAILLGTGLGSVVAHATETITYTYDTRGRVLAITHSGTVNNGIVTTYSHDKADNRTQVQTTGASH